MPAYFKGRLGVIQRVLPTYRAPFFEKLAKSCSNGLSLFAGQPLKNESIVTTASLEGARVFAAQNVHIFSPGSPLYACYQRGLITWLESWNPDALVVEANFRYLSSNIAMRWMKKQNRPVLGWGLGAPVERGMPGMLRNRFLGQFDGMLAYSQRGADQYAACGIPVDNIFVAHNAAVPAPLHPLPPRLPEYDGRPNVLFVGRLQARKRIPALLKACASLPDALKPQLVIVGDGPEMTGLKLLAAKIYPEAEFVGARHGPSLESYFRRADLFVLPGTGGLAVQQAMSFGLPVIVARGDGTQDDLVRPENGWQITPEDDDVLFSTLADALSDVFRLREMGVQSYRIVSAEINLENMVEAFTRALNWT